MLEYKINYLPEKPCLSSGWNNKIWQKAETALLAYVCPESAGNIPVVKVKFLYHNEGLSGIFYVQDEYVICRSLNVMDPVWKDSCVEMFVKPQDAEGYFNFEFNALGVLYASYIINPERTEGGFKEYIPFTKEDCLCVKTSASYKNSITDEIKEKTAWTMQFDIPFALFEKYTGKLTVPEGAAWRGNFNKCADDSPNPHWITWSPINELNFHAPESFGNFTFEKK